MKQSKNIPGIIIYTIIIFLCIITIFSGYGNVSDNLDGWHNFSKSHAIIFVFLCLLMAVECIYNINNILKEKEGKHIIIIGATLIILPLLFHIFAIRLQGNADSDLQYLLLRTFQGFDHTYLFLVVSAVLGIITLFYYNAKR